MNFSIENHIFNLLKHHDCVIITGLGGFILNYRKAYLNNITNQIHPPSKSISFNQNLVNNDGLLANYISSIEQISYDEACLEIMKFSRKTKLKLAKGTPILFDNIGTLYSNNEKILFESQSTFNFNTNSYGFTSFKLSKIHVTSRKSQQSIVAAAAVIILLICISVFSLSNNYFDNLLVFNLNPIKTANYVPRSMTLDSDSLGKETPGIYNVQVSKVDPDLYKVNGTNYHITTKKCFKEGFGRDVQIKIWKDEKDRTQRQVCFLNPQETEYDDCFKIINVYNEMTSNSKKIMVLMKNGRMKEALLVLEESYIDPYVIANSSPDEEINTEIKNNDSLLIKDIPNRFVDAIQSISKPQTTENIKQVKVNTIENLVEPVQNTKDIHIIVGSFSEQKNAHALSKQLKNRGFKNSKIVGENKNGLIRVAVASFYTEEEAKQALVGIKLQLSSAWVLNSE